MVPMLTLGVPGSGTTAVMIGALTLYNITPGPLLFQQQPDIVWGLIASLFIANVMLIILNVPMVRVFTRILAVPNWPWCRPSRSSPGSACTACMRPPSTCS